MCLQVVIAALYYNPPMLFEMLNSLQISEQSVTEQFIKQWLHDCDVFMGYVRHFFTINSAVYDQPKSLFCEVTLVVSLSTLGYTNRR